MAQGIEDILKELDAGYNPAKQAINDQIAQLQPQADQQVQGLKAQQSNAFNDITNGARDRGMGFSGIPLDEQAKYTAGTFLPAVANVQASVNNSKNSLLDSLNNLNIQQRTQAYGIRDNQATLEEQKRQFDAQQAAALAQQKAAAASQASLSSILGGGGSTTQTPATNDPYATVNKAGANTAIKQLLGTNNPNLIAQTLNAISASAARGNLYDKYKLDLLQSLQGNSQYGPLLSKVSKTNNSKVPGATY